MLKKFDYFLGGLMVKNRKKKNHADEINSKARRLVLVVVCAISFFCVFKGLMQIPQIKSNQAKIQELNDSIKYEQLRQEEIDELKDKVDTDEYIEKIAGEKLGLVKNNARIFIDVSE